MADPLADPRFRLVPPGRFRDRRGPVGADVPYSLKKLCLVATDAAFLVEFLYGLSLRQDCFYVKYGTVARDGMYLGRCFLTTDVAAGELCEILKGHPRLMVSLQDDGWFNDFRVDASELDSGIWDDWPEHEADVADCSSDVRALALVTLGVVPAHQQKGFGARLIDAALQRARALGYASVFVRGPRDYFARYGFVSASAYGLSWEPASSVDAEHTFMAIELVPGALASVTGAVRYQCESRTF